MEPTEYADTEADDGGIMSGRTDAPYVVVKESNGAKLVRYPDGTVKCLCPFACLATYEPCEFAPEPS